MDNKHIPLLSHLKTSLARVFQLISEVTNATADALLEMSDEVNGKMDVSVYDPAGGGRQVAFKDELPAYYEPAFTGNVELWLTDSDGNVLVADSGEGITANWKYQRL